MREIRRVALIEFDNRPFHGEHPQADEVAWDAWRMVTDEAYQTLKLHVPDDGWEDITPIEPFNGTPQGFEWRAYWHHPDGHESLYVVVREIPEPSHDVLEDRGHDGSGRFW